MVLLKKHMGASPATIHLSKHQAEPLYRRVLASHESNLGPSHNVTVAENLKGSPRLKGGWIGILNWKPTLLKTNIGPENGWLED